MPFMEILLLESNTLNGTIYRCVSVSRWLHHVAISHVLPARENSPYSVSRLGKSHAEFSLSFSAAAKFCEWKFICSSSSVISRPSKRSDATFSRQRILWNSNSQVQGRIFIKKVFHLQDLPFSSKKCRVEENSRWELLSASAWDKCGRLKCNKNSSAAQFIIPREIKVTWNLAFSMECN